MVYSQTHDVCEHNCYCIHQNHEAPAHFLPICNNSCVHKRHAFASSVVFLIQQPSRKRGCNCIPPINLALFVFLLRPQRYAATAVFAMSFNYEVGHGVMEHLLGYPRSTS